MATKRVRSLFTHTSYLQSVVYAKKMLVNLGLNLTSLPTLHWCSGPLREKKLSCAKFISVVNWITVCTVNIYTIILYTTCLSHPPMSLLSYHKTIQKKNKCLHVSSITEYFTQVFTHWVQTMQWKLKDATRKGKNLKASYGAPFLGKSLGAPEKYPLFPPPLRGLLMSTGLCTMWTLRLYLLYCLDHMRVK